MGFFRREQMDCCNYVESTGSRIVMDSDTNWMELESIQGNTTQFSTTGAQLLDFSGINDIIGEVTINIANGSYTISGTGTLTSSVEKRYRTDIKKLLKPGILTLKSTISTPRLYITIRNTSTQFISLYGNNSGQITQEMLDDESIYVEVMFFGSKNTVITPGTYYPMLYQDDDGIWEPYTGGKPSPSPQYPQEIKGIGESGNINVTVAGAQLFDITKYSTSISQWIITDNRIAIENPTSTYLTIIYTIDVLPNTNYTLSSIIHNDVAGTNSMHIVVSIIKNTGEVISNVVIIDEASSSPKTFTVPEDGKQINVYIRNRTIGNGGYVENVMLNQGNTSLSWQPYYSPQNISITLTKPLYGIDNYNDEITVTKRIDKCIEFTFNGSENWAVISTYEGFYYAGILPFTAMRRAGFCNQFPVDTKGEMIESIRIGNGNSVLFCVYSSFYDDTATDKGLAAWKAHLSTNPLKIVTYINPEGYVETPLEQSNIDAIKSLYAYNGYTIVNNNENTNMKIMYKTKS